MMRLLLLTCIVTQILSSNYLQQANTCTSYPCAQCTSNGLSCTTCLQQYYLNTFTNQCLACSFPCILCSNPNQCSYCFINFYAQNGLCQNCPSDPSACQTLNCCNQCFQNYYYVYETNICNQCITTSVCQSCINPNGPSACFICAQGFSLLNGLCVSCSIVISNCQACNLADPQNVFCQICLNGYYLSGVMCLKCPYTCSTCLNSTICTGCASQYYLNSTNQLCQLCLTQFCSICYYQNLIQTCKSCILGYVLSGGQCIVQNCGEFCLSCNEWGCLNCIEGYFSDQNGCSQCGNGCISCVGIQSAECVCPVGLTISGLQNYEVCLGCPENCLYCIQVQLQIQQLQTNCLVCLPGFYVYWFSNLSFCASCPNNCLYCSSYMNCYYCNVSFYVMNDFCSPCPQNCNQCANYTSCLICSYSFYLNISTQLCQPCTQNCYNCINQTCLLCQPTYYLINGTCVGCPFGVSNCNNCNQTSCFNCSAYFFLENGACLQCSDHCYNCLNQSYCTLCDKSWILDNNNECVACGQNCLICYSISQCVYCVSSDYVNNGGNCIHPFSLQWWEIASLILLLILFIIFVAFALFLKKTKISNQIRAIIISNFKINYRNRLFLKQALVTMFILAVMIVQIETQLQAYIYSYPKAVITFYNILAIILVSRSSVMTHIQNRNKFLYFQKAYGLNSAAYTLTWMLYSLLVGAIHFFLFIAIQYIYLKSNSAYFNKHFNMNTVQGNLVMSYQQFCLINFLAYISTYSYFLFATIILSHNQLGQKLLTPILVLGLIGIQQGTLYTEVNLQKFIYLSPIGWLVSISNYGLIQNSYLLKAKFYMPIFFSQFFIPIILSFLIEFVKINQVQIKILLMNNYNKIWSKLKVSSKVQPLNQTELDATTNLSWLIKIQNLKKKVNKKMILNDINLIIRKGQVISLYGKNGSAKSTIFNILTNIDHFSEGNFVFSKNVKIGISLQENFFEDELSVRQNLLFYARLKGQNIQQQTLQLQDFGLSDFWDKKYNQISGGSKKKLSIACAFLGENDLVLLDYPTMGIDYKVKKEIQLIIKKYKQRLKQTTIIITTCNLQFDFIDLVDRVWVINKGQILIDQQICNIKSKKENIIIGKIKKCQYFTQTCKQQLSKVNGINAVNQKSTFGIYFKQSQLLHIIQIIKKHNLLAQFQLATPSIKQKMEWKINQAFGQGRQNQICQQLSVLFKEYHQMKQKQHFLGLLASSFIIRYYQIAPSIFDIIYFLLIPIICWYYFIWLLEDGKNLATKQIGITFFIHFYPYQVIFMYSQIATHQVKFQESGYQSIIFKTGMKKIPYWIASYIINIIIILVPSIIVMLVSGQHQYLSIFSLSITTYSVAFTLLSYFCSIFFSSFLVCFSFLSIILATVYTYFGSLDNYLSQFNKQNQQAIQRFFIATMPSFLFEFANYSHQYLLLFIINTLTYFLLYFIIKQAVYRFRCHKRQMPSSSMLQNTYQEAIDQKLKVLDIVQNPFQNEKSSLIVSDVYLKYQKEKLGIKGLNLCIQKGTIFALLGMNGSGKSTTLKLIIKETFQTIGEIYFDFQEIKSQTSQIYQRIYISPQNNYFIPQMKVMHHLRIFCFLKGISFNIQTKFIKLLLMLFQMEDCANLLIRQLSGGNQRKLKLITALLGKPDFLMMDESTIGIDDQSERIMGKILIMFAQQFKSSCVYVTHKLQQVERYCTKLGIMKKGGLVICESNQKFIQRYSRGFQLNLYSYQAKKNYPAIKQMLSKSIRVYQSLLIEKQCLLRILIPFEQYSLDNCLQIILSLKENEYIYGFQLKKQGLIQAFDYMVNQAETSVIISSSSKI